VAAWIAAACLFVPGSCSEGIDDGDAAPASTTTSSSLPATTAPTYGLQEIARLEQPTAIAAVPGTDDVLISERLGRVWRLGWRDGRLEPTAATPWLDLTSEVDAGPEEQGLLGLAVAPDGRSASVSFTDRDRHVRVRSYDLTGTAGSGRDLAVVPMPEGNTHGAGGLAYGPDGALYAGFGDNRGGVFAGTWARIERLDPSSGTSTPWVSGLRNPWRFSFDPLTDSLWIADVGGNIGGDRQERVYSVPAGAAVDIRSGVEPELHYSADAGGCAVIGGALYRGTELPELDGSYVFADFCEGLLSYSGVDGSPEPLGVEVAHPSSVSAPDGTGIVVLSLTGSVSVVRTD